MSEDLSERLLLAVKLGDLAGAKKLLNHGADVNASCSNPSENGYTPLHYAAAKGNTSLVKLLLNKGAKINATAIKKITPLYLATEKSEIKVVKLLLENGADVNTCIENGKSVLYLAVERANLNMTEEILRFRPEINNEANRRSIYVPYKRYESEKFEGSVDALLRYGFTVTAEEAKDTVLLFNVFERGPVKMVEAFLKLGADVNTMPKVETDDDRNRSLLSKAILEREVELVELLLNYGANANFVDSSGHSAMWYAIYRRDATITKLLLKHRAGFRVTTDVLHAAVQESRELVEMLLKMTPDINVNTCSENGTALHCLVRSAISFRLPKWFPSDVEDDRTEIEKEIDSSEIAKMLLSRGACVNAKWNGGTIPLHLAAKGGYIKVVEVLLENKADVNSLTEDHETPLHWAVAGFYVHNNVRVVKILLDYGANIGSRDKNGRTALHRACRNCQVESVKLLVERGANLNAGDTNGWSPLHLAVMRGSVKVVTTLLKLGANVKAKDKRKRTALHLVGSRNGPEITKILLDYGADINVTCANFVTPLDNANAKIQNYWEGNDEVVEDDTSDYHDYHKAPFGPSAFEEIAKILQERTLEMENMKIRKIGDSDVTFYDFLTRDWDQLVIYARNKSIVKTIKSKNVRREFPSYCEMITLRFKQGQKRESLLGLSIKSFKALFGYVVPDLPLIKIFNYLSNNDLENLIKADSDN